MLRPSLLSFAALLAGLVLLFNDSSQMRSIARAGEESILPSTEQTEPDSFFVFALREQQGSVDPMTGIFSLELTDLDVPRGPTELVFRRRLAVDQKIPGTLGRQWVSNWDTRLIANPDSPLVIDAGREILFRPRPQSGIYWAACGDELVLADGKATRTRPDGAIDTFNAEGRLTSRRTGDTLLTPTYDDAGRISLISGPNGAQLTLTYDGPRVVQVSNFLGDTVSYRYEGDNLVEVQPKAQAAIRYGYSKANRLTRILNPQFKEVTIAYEPQGRVLSRSWADGSTERLEYDDTNHTVRYIAPDDKATVTRLNPAERTIHVTSASGTESSMKLNRAGQIAEMTGPTGKTVQFTYDDRMRLNSVNDEDGAATQYIYRGDAATPTQIVGRKGLISATERDGENRVAKIRSGSASLSLEYDTQGRPAAIQSSVGPSYALGYDTEGRVNTITNDLGDKLTMQYDDRGNVVQTIDYAGNTQRRTYDDAGRPTSMTDAAGETTRFEYTASGMLAAIVDPRGEALRYQYHGRVVSIIDPLGDVTKRHFSPTGFLTKEVDALDRATRYNYDESGNLTQVINPAGGATTIAYDALARRTAVTGPDGLKTQYRYNEAGNLEAIVDSFGRSTTYEYDERGRLTQTVDPDGTETVWNVSASPPRVEKVIPAIGPAVQYVYDSRGNVAQIWKGQRILQKFEYDQLDRLMKETSGQGISTEYAYDATGNLTAWKSSLGEQGEIEYDKLGQPIVESRSGVETRHQYDEVGNHRGTDFADSAYRRNHDAVGRLLTVAIREGRHVNYEYDPAGQLLAVSTQSGSRTTFGYDALGNPTLAADPLGRATHSRYDAAGRLLSTTDALGQTTTYRYGPQGQLARKQLADGTTVRYEYDERGNLTSVDDGKFPVQYTYDQYDRQTEIAYPAIQRKLTYQYDPETGRLAAFTDSEGRTIEYEYDQFDRVSAITAGDGQEFRFTYDAANRLVRTEYPNGVAGQQAYDKQGHLLGVIYSDKDSQPLDGTSYTYDSLGRPTSKQGKTESVEYHYDVEGRLLEERSAQTGEIKYEYDDEGNRKLRQHCEQRTQYACDPANQLLSAGSERFEYDANGNLVKRIDGNAVTQYTYDAQNQLIQVTLPDRAVVQYGYAPTGERIWREDAAGRVHFVGDGEHVWAELDGSLKPTTTYVHGLSVDRPLAVKRGEAAYYYHADNQGTITSLTNASGKLQQRYACDAFGVPATEDDAKGPFAAPLANSLRYTGREWDAATGLYYYRARYYDPKLGRFLTVDPQPIEIGEPDTLNAYAYVDNTPTLYTDPTGMSRDLYSGQGYLNRVLRAEGFGTARYNPNMEEFGAARVRGTSAFDFRVKNGEIVHVEIGPHALRGGREQVLATNFHEGQHVLQHGHGRWNGANRVGARAILEQEAHLRTAEYTVRQGFDSNITESYISKYRRFGGNEADLRGRLERQGYRRGAASQRGPRSPGQPSGRSPTPGGSMLDRALRAGGNMLLVMEGTDIVTEIVAEGGSKESIVKGMVRAELTLFFVGTTTVLANSLAIGGAATAPAWLPAAASVLVAYAIYSGASKFQSNLSYLYDRVLLGIDRDKLAMQDLSSENVKRYLDVRKRLEELEELKDRADQAAALANRLEQFAKDHQTRADETLRAFETERKKLSAFGSMTWLNDRSLDLQNGAQKKADRGLELAEQAIEIFRKVIEEAQGGCDKAKYQRLRAEVARGYTMVLELRRITVDIHRFDNELSDLGRRRAQASMVLDEMNRLAEELGDISLRVQTTTDQFAKCNTRYSEYREQLLEKVSSFQREVDATLAGLNPKEGINSSVTVTAEIARMRDLWYRVRHRLKDLDLPGASTAIGNAPVEIKFDIETLYRQADEFVTEAHNELPDEIPGAPCEEIIDALSAVEQWYLEALQALYMVDEAQKAPELADLSELHGLVKVADPQKPTPEKKSGLASALAGLARSDKKKPPKKKSGLASVVAGLKKSDKKKPPRGNRPDPPYPPPVVVTPPKPQPQSSGLVLRGGLNSNWVNSVNYGGRASFTATPITVQIAADGSATFSGTTMQIAIPNFVAGTMTFSAARTGPGAVKTALSGGRHVPVAVAFRSNFSFSGRDFWGDSHSRTDVVQFTAQRLADGRWTLVGKSSNSEPSHNPQFVLSPVK